MEKELENFLEYIMDIHTDKYGHLQICKEGDEIRSYYKKKLLKII